MKRSFKKIVSVISAAALLAMPVSVFASSFDSTLEVRREKLTGGLQQKLEATASNEKIPVYIWTNDLSESDLETETVRRTGLTKQKIAPVEAQELPADYFDPELPQQQYRARAETYLEATKAQRAQEQTLTDTYIDTKRQVAREKYTAMHQSDLAILGLDQEDVMFSSQYAPMMIAALTPDQIDRVTRYSQVESVQRCWEAESEPQDQSLATSLASVDANYTRDTLGFTGNGVKVGQFEFGTPDPNHSQLKAGNVSRLKINTLIHATRVARIMLGNVGVAPDAKLVSTYYGGTTESFYEQIEALLNSGVKVINMSWGWVRASDMYWPAERWLDHVSVQHGVTVVNASGNAAPSMDIMAPALAYNVITVGGIDDNNTTNKGDDSLYEKSSAANGGTAGCAKPDFLAPAVSVIDGASGTSYAAPIVTGIIAQMLEFRPSLATNPALIKAILTASCDRKVTSETLAAGLTAVEGAGVVNAKKAISLISQNRYTAYVQTSDTMNRSLNVTSSDVVIRVALAWDRFNRVGTHTSGSVTTGPYVNYSLYVLKPGGAQAGKSTIPTSSVELVHLSRPAAGTYTIRVTKPAGTAQGNVALAWW